MSAFGGFPPEFDRFFRDLRVDNTREFWTTRADDWRLHVRGPFSLLTDELGAEFGSLRIMRPNRDVRFSADKTPYKTWISATDVVRATGGTGHYVEFSDAGVRAGCGAMLFDGPQRRRFQDSLATDAGEELDAILRDCRDSGHPASGGIDPPLRRVPASFGPAHPRAELARWKGLAVVTEISAGEWMRGRAAIERVQEAWRAATPLLAWIAARVVSAETTAA